MLSQGLASMSVDEPSQDDDAQQVFAGRIDVLYALGRHYLSLPFAVLCVPATLLAGRRLGLLPITPLLLHLAVRHTPLRFLFVRPQMFRLRDRARTAMVAAE